MRLIYVFYSLVILNVFGCQEKKVDADTQVQKTMFDTLILTAEQLESIGLSYGNIESRQISSEIKVQGMIDLPPQNIISVNFSLGGYLKSTKLIPGMKVSKGEIIAMMEDQSIVQLQQDYLMSKAKHDLAKKDYDRQKLLFDANASTSKTLQQVESELKIQTINMGSLAEKLKLIGIDVNNLNASNIKGQVPIRSTINGYVSKVHVNTGKYVQPTETLFELIDPDDIHVALTLFEKDIPNVKKGDLVKVSLMQEPGVQYEAEVILVNRNIDDDRTAMAHCHFLNHPAYILPGMFVEAVILVKNKQSFVIPEDAIVETGNKKYIYITVGVSKFKMIEVSTGQISQGFVEILSDPNSFKKDSIVVGNAYKLYSINNMDSDE
jgi:cobalt-zinc-cadmium efflux system membrane fusion protein